MKNLFFALIAMIAFTVFSGCNKDDDDMGTTVKNEFTYDGTKHSIAKGYLSSLGSNGNGTFDYDIFLTTAGITKGGAAGLTGMGDYVYLDLNSISTTGLVAGTYNWSNSRTDFSVVPGSATFLNYDFATFSGTTLAATAGTVDVAISGTETTVTFSLTLTGGKTVTGEWKGVLDTL